jgi:5-methylcytosine-specific restriction endonuclease McrA
MKYRSKKTARLYIQRRKLVAEMLDDAICARCDSARATEVHEILTRARGGSILDKDNCVALCHDCHSFITLNPAQGKDEGWLKNSWEGKR